MVLRGCLDIELGSTVRHPPISLRVLVGVSVCLFVGVGVFAVELFGGLVPS